MGISLTFYSFTKIAPVLYDSYWYSCEAFSFIYPLIFTFLHLPFILHVEPGCQLLGQPLWQPENMIPDPEDRTRSSEWGQKCSSSWNSVEMTSPPYHSAVRWGLHRGSLFKLLRHTLQHLQCLRNEFPDEFTRLPRITEGLNQLGTQEKQMRSLFAADALYVLLYKKRVGVR